MHRGVHGRQDLVRGTFREGRGLGDQHHDAEANRVVLPWSGNAPSDVVRQSGKVWVSYGRTGQAAIGDIDPTAPAASAFTPRPVRASTGSPGWSPPVSWRLRSAHRQGRVSLSRSTAREGSAPDQALGWLDQAWEAATVVPKRLFSVGDDVIVDSTDQDGVVRPGRLCAAGQWLCNIFSGGQTARHDERSLSARPTAGDAAAWVAQVPVSPDRFAAAFSRAKLLGHGTRPDGDRRRSRSVRAQPPLVTGGQECVLLVW
jgi:hypothetical protein